MSSIILHTMTLSVLLDHVGIAVSALSGVLAAKGKQLDLFGVLVLAMVTAFGGGSLRDILTGSLPVAWLRSPEYFTNACLTAVIGFYLCRWWTPPYNLLLVADAVALAFFCVVGTQKGLALGFASSVSITQGVITGVAGGVIRDTLTSRVPLVFRRDTYFYATAAMFGGLAYCVLEGPLGGERATWTALAAALILRLGAIRYRLSLPSFEPHET